MYQEVNYFAEASTYNTFKLQELRSAHEESPQYLKRFRWSERHLQCIWFDGRYRPTDLKLLSGESITVINPGTWNLEAGPDFLDAQIMINPGSRQVSGDIEIHIYPSDWDNHRHSDNPNYENVILHVSWFKSPLSKSLPESTLSLSLADKMLSKPWVFIDDIDIKAYPHNILPETPRPCQCCLQNHPEYTHALLTAAGYHRLENKTMTITRSLEDRAEREQIFYEEFMGALGYKHNKLAFRALAKLTPLSTFQKSSNRNLAILLGTAGLLPQPDDVADPSAARYIRALWDIWWKSGLTEVENDIQWALHNLRPNNHPTRRLAAAAALFSGERTLVTRLDELDPKIPGADWIKKVFAIFNEFCEWRFWNQRLLFNSTPSEEHHYKLIGSRRAAAILNNVIIPFYAAEKRLPLSTFNNLPAEDISAAMRTAAYYILGRDHNPALYATNGLLQQGLLQIYLDFCLPAKTSCRDCKLYEKIKTDLT